MKTIRLELPGGPVTATCFHPDDPVADVVDVVYTWLERDRPIAFDVETTTLLPSTGRLRMIQFGDHDSAVVIPARFAQSVGGLLWLIGRPLAHNGLFDTRWMQHAGIPGHKMTALVDRLTDTQAMAHLYDPRPAFVDPDADDWDEEPVGLGLKELAVRFVGPDADRYERELMLAHDLPVSRGKVWGRLWEAIPDGDPYLQAYAAADPVLTTRLHAELARRLSPEEIELLDVERRITAQAWRIIQSGLHVDADGAAQVRDELLRERGVVERQLVEYGVSNPDSTQQCLKALAKVDAPLTKTTKKGALSTDKDVLQGLADHGAGAPAHLAGLIRQGRRSKSYATKYADKLAISGGLVHPFVRVNGARTGRWAMAEPPVQQWPKQPLATSAGSFDLRALMRAPKGQSLIACDLSSIETVVGARVCSDANMIAAIDKPLGQKLTIYDDLATQLGITRAVAKIVVLSGIYGVGNAKLAVQLGTNDLNMVKRLRVETFGGYWCADKACQIANADPFGCEAHIVWEDGFYGGPRQMRRRIERGEVEVEERDGWPGIRNLYGRWVPARVKYRSAGTPDWFTIFNHAVQGAARDLLMRMLLDVADAGLTPWLTVHDEIIVAVDRADAADARRTLISIMQHHRHPVIGLPIHCEAGPPAARWGTQGKPIR